MDSPSRMSTRILIVAPAWLGDMIMAHSLIQLLKARTDQPILAVLAPRSTLEVTQLMPEITEHYVMEDQHGELHLAYRLSLSKKIARLHFDEAYILPNTLKSALVPFFARIPKRIGAKGEGRYFLLNDLRSQVEAYPLMVERYVSLAYPKGQFESGMPFPYPHLQVNSSLQMKVRERFQMSEVQPILVLSPGAAYGPAKRWPIDSFAKVARAKQQEGMAVYVIGGAAEQALGEQLAALVPGIHNVVGRTSLLEMAALLSLATQVLTNDSGPMHVAASLGVSTYAIFGSSSAQFTPPLGEQVEVIEQLDLSCRPCFQRVCPLGHFDCLHLISPEMVLKRMIR